MIKITGFDKLTRDLDEAKKALDSLDGHICKVKFDPADPGSIEAAVSEMEQMIDRRLGRYAGNRFVAPLVEQAKAHFRKGFLDKAAAARLAGKAQ